MDPCPFVILSVCVSFGVPSVFSWACLIIQTCHPRLYTSSMRGQMHCFLYTLQMWAHPQAVGLQTSLLFGNGNMRAFLLHAWALTTTLSLALGLPCPLFCFSPLWSSITCKSAAFCFGWKLALVEYWVHPVLKHFNVFAALSFFIMFFSVRPTVLSDLLPFSQAGSYDGVHVIHCNFASFKFETHFWNNSNPSLF